jgi:hypothetical protein
LGLISRGIHTFKEDRAADAAVIWNAPQNLLEDNESEV